MANVDYERQPSYDLEDAAEGDRHAGHGIGGTTRRLVDGSRRSLQQPEEPFATTIEPVYTPASHVKDLMKWTGVMLFLGGGVASALGCYIFGPILGLFFNRFGAGFFAFVGFPLYELFMVSVRNTEGVNDANIRFSMLSLSLTQGLLAGYALSNYYLDSQPLLCLTPLVIAYVFPLLSDYFGHDRRQVVILSAAAALVVNVLLAAAFGILGRAYVSLSLLYVTFTAVVLQHMMRYVHRVEDQIHLYHVTLFTGFLVIKALVYGIFGTSYEVIRFETARLAAEK